MTNEEISKLKQGDVVRHEPSGAGYIVLSNRTGVPTVVRTLEIHNPSEWEHVYTPSPVKAEGVKTQHETSPWARLIDEQGGLTLVDIITELERIGWTYGIKSGEWTSPNGGTTTKNISSAWKHRHDFAKRASALATEIPAPHRPMLPPFREIQEQLRAAGWVLGCGSQWRSPSGTTYFGSRSAWLAMGTKTEPLRPVKSFAEARAALVSAGWKNVCGRVWRSPLGALVDGTLAAYKIVTKQTDDGTCNAS